MIRSKLFATTAMILVGVGCAAAPDASMTNDETIATTESALTCERQSNLRPVYPLTNCPDADKSGALCYPACRPGYHGAGPMCWEDCPPGYTDDGATCRRDAHIISADNSQCPWYDKCGLTFSKGCSTCPDGYSNDGCTCRRDVHIFAKSSYGRGVGWPMSCAPGLQQIGALCYGACPSGWQADGVQCLGDTICHADPPPPKPVYAFCFKATRDSDISPCSVYVQYAHDLNEAKQLVQTRDTGATFTQINCSQQDTACRTTSRPPIHKPGGPLPIE